MANDAMQVRHTDKMTVHEASPEGQPGEPIIQFFAYGHLPPRLAVVSKDFHDLAHAMLTLPRNAERSVALRKLLEAKDAAVRALMAGH